MDMNAIPPVFQACMPVDTAHARLSQVHVHLLPLPEAHY